MDEKDDDPTTTEKTTELAEPDFVVEYVDLLTGELVTPKKIQGVLGQEVTESTSPEKSSETSKMKFVVEHIDLQTGKTMSSEKIRDATGKQLTSVGEAAKVSPTTRTVKVSEAEPNFLTEYTDMQTNKTVISKNTSVPRHVPEAPLAKSLQLPKPVNQTKIHKSLAQTTTGLQKGFLVPFADIVVSVCAYSLLFAVALHWAVKDWVILQIFFPCFRVNYLFTVNFQVDG